MRAALLTFNEAYSWGLAQLPWRELVLRTSADVHPPFYYLLLKAWVAFAGDSVTGLRGLSAICLAISATMIFIGVRRWVGVGPVRDAAGWPHQAGALAALLLALNPLQVAMAWNARMYALGVALSALALAALGKALSCPERSGRAWVVFTFASAASLWTHNFALFTVAAELGVAGALVLLWMRDPALRPWVGREWKRLALAACGIGVLYAPWVGVLAWQVRDVATDYWITAPDRLDFLVDLSVWAAGAGNLGHDERLAWCVLPIGLALAAVVRKDTAVLALLAIALLPWVGYRLAEQIVGRPLYQLRYLSFAQVAWMAFLGLGTARLPHRATRWTVAVALVMTTASGLWDHIEQARRRAAGPAALVQAIDVLKAQANRDDLIVVNGAAELNLVRYYALHAGTSNRVVTTMAPRTPQPGHVSHLAALGPGDFLTDHDPRQPVDRRLWAVVFGSGPPRALPVGFTSTSFQTWRDTANTTIELSLHVRDVAR